MKTKPSGSPGPSNRNVCRRLLSHRAGGQQQTGAALHVVICDMVPENCHVGQASSGSNQQVSSSDLNVILCGFAILLIKTRGKLTVAKYSRFPKCTKDMKVFKSAKNDSTNCYQALRSTGLKRGLYLKMYNTPTLSPSRG